MHTRWLKTDNIYFYLKMGGGGGGGSELDLNIERRGVYIIQLKIKSCIWPIWSISTHRFSIGKPRERIWQLNTFYFPKNLQVQFFFNINSQKIGGQKMNTAKSGTFRPLTFRTPEPPWSVHFLHFLDVVTTSYRHKLMKRT